MTYSTLKSSLLVIASSFLFSHSLSADVMIGKYKYSHGVLPEIQGEYWWTGNPEYRKYSGKHHFFLNKDGSGTFHFTAGTQSSFKWGVHVDENNKPRLYSDRYKELDGCYMVGMVFDNGEKDGICINLKSGHGILGTTHYQRK